MNTIMDMDMEMDMKVYKTREELTEDVKYIKKTILDINYKKKLINQLFDIWKKTADDSPWNINKKNLERNAVKTLIKISEEGISNEWSGEHIIFEEVKKNNHYNLRKRK